jgi:hypothetical protein
MADQFSANSAFSEEKKILTTQWLAYSYFCSEFQVQTMNIGKRIRLNRIFSHPSGRLCSVAIDHFIGYGKLMPGGGLWKGDARAGEGEHHQHCVDVGHYFEYAATASGLQCFQGSRYHVDKIAGGRMGWPGRAR